jgi:aspartate racemase
MGPEATADFFTKLLQTTQARSDQDHLHILIDNDPKVPNRHAAIRGEAPSVAPALTAMAKRLEEAGADFLVMVCNTAHAYQDEISASVGIPFVSLIDEVVSFVAETYPDHRSIGLMAADGCLEAELYQKALGAKALKPVLWNERNLSGFMELVYRIKSGERTPDIRASMKILAEDLAQKGASLIISGCTEIPLVLTSQDLAIPLVSSSEILVARTHDYAKRRSPLPSNFRSI